MSLQTLVSDIKKKKAGKVDLSFMKNVPDAGMNKRPLPGTTISKAPSTSKKITDYLPKTIREGLMGTEGQGVDVVPREQRPASQKGLVDFLAPFFRRSESERFYKRADNLIAKGIAEDRAYDLSLKSLRNEDINDLTDEEEKKLRLEKFKETTGQFVDVVGNIPLVGATKNVAQKAFTTIAKESDPLKIAEILKNTFTKLDDFETLKTLAPRLKDVTDENEVQKIIDVAIKSKAPTVPVKTMAEKMPESPLLKNPHGGFSKSANQKPIGKSNFVLGDYGKNTIDRKIKENLPDRLPSSKLEETTLNIKKTYKAGDSSFRKDNLVHVAEMPNGETRAIITRLNTQGKEEVVNFFKVSKDKEKFVKNLESFGTPERTRTSNLLVRTDTLSPLSYGDTATIPQEIPKKQVTPTPQTNKVSAIDHKRELTQLDKLIAENKVRVVSRNGKDTYQVKKGDTWITKRDEDSALKYFEPKPKKPGIQIDPKLEERLLAARIAKEALDENPLKELSKFVAKRGEFKGQIGEATGKKVGPKDGYTFDAKVMDMGIDDTEVARAQYAQYRDRVADNAVEIAEARDAIKLARQEEKMRQEAEKAKDALIDPRYTTPDITQSQVKSLEETANQLVEDLPLSPSEKPMSLKEIVTQTPLKGKVNLLDYIRTPDRVLKKIGFEKEAQFLRNQYEEYVKELPKNIDKITDWYKQVPKDSGERIFQWLDGKEVQLYGNELKVAGEIKAYLAEWADRLGLPQDNRVTNYITHLFDDQLLAKEFDEDLAKIIANKIPGEVYDPFLLRRLGAQGYKQDVWGALDAYTKRATRKVHLDPALEKMQDKAGASLEFSNLEQSQFDYIKSYVDRVNMRPTNIDNLLDNGFKQIFGYGLGQRPINRISGLMRRLTYRGMLGLNLGSALRNLSQGVNTYAVLGERDIALGYMKLFSKENRDELAREGILANNFIQDRALSSTKKLMEKADKGLWVFFDAAEKLNRGSAYLGAKSKALRKGMNEKDAIEYAKTIVRKTQFQYDAVDTPVALSSDLVKTLMQFQTYTTKQTEFLAELAYERNFAALARYGLAGLAFVYTIGEAFGMEPKELLPVYRFDTPPSLKFPVELTKALLDAPDKYGNDRDLEQKASDVGKTMWGLVPGGMQLKKTVQGMEASSEGGSYDASGKKQFEVGGTPLKDAQSALFGKYASKEAKDYFDKGTGDKTFDTLKDKDNKQKAEERKTVKGEVDALKGASKEEVQARLLELAQEDKKMAEKVLDGLIEEKQNLSSFEKKLKESSVNVRAEYVAEKMAELDTKEEKKAYALELTEKGILTESVLDRLIELQQ